jgi:hypothetical protein
MYTIRAIGWNSLSGGGLKILKILINIGKASTLSNSFYLLKKVLKITTSPSDIHRAAAISVLHGVLKI